MVGGTTTTTLEFAAVLKSPASAAFDLACQMKKRQLCIMLNNTNERPELAGCPSERHLRFQQPFALIAVAIAERLVASM